MADGTRPSRFSVSSDLLRLATEDRGEEEAAVPAEPVERPAALAAPGLGGPGPITRPNLTEVLRSQSASRLGVLLVAAAVPPAVLAALRAMAVHLRHSLHVSPAGLEAVLVGGLVIGLATGPLVGLAADRWGRLRVGAAGAIAAGVAGLLIGAAPSLALAALLVAGLGVAASCQVVAHLAWLADTYPSGARARLLAGYGAALALGATLGRGAVGAAAAMGGSWRFGMVVSVVGVGAGVALLRLPAPVARGPEREVDPIEVGIGPTAQRLRRLRSVVGLLAAASVLGFAAVGLPVQAAAYLQHHWHQPFAARGPIYFRAGLGGLAGAPLAGWLGDWAWARSPAKLFAVVGGAIAAFGSLLVVSAYLPGLALVEVAWALALAALTVAALVTAQAVMAVAPVAARGVALGVAGAYGLVCGGVGATIVLAAVSQSQGARLGLSMAGTAGLLAAALVLGSATRFGEDVASATVDAAAGEQDGGRGDAVHRRPAALLVRHVDFSYGTRQVLFDVGLEVAEGEVAALLGTNGAGKSTLLRLVAGLDHPASGAIRLWGRDATYLEAEQVVGLGVAMLPGGRMSFPGLTVLENLRVGGHTIRRQGARLQAAIDEVLALFPVLGERREQRVGTLSGGEQQMLALGRVLLTRPRLLLIDELSLGLAPKAVESLLTIVRRVNEEGTTVLLVEQSVNLALHLAHHALFLERGAVRFDGETAELLTRHDLLRPVFLSRHGGSG